MKKEAMNVKDTRKVYRRDCQVEREGENDLNILISKQ